MTTTSTTTPKFGRIALIGLGLVMWLHLWWLVWPGALVVAGGLAYRERRRIGRPAEAVQAALWCIGMALVCAAAGLPLLLSRGANQMTVVQSGLASSAIHLLGSVLVASAMFVRGLIATYPLLIWLAAFFATTLVTLTIIIAQHVRKSAAAANPIGPQCRGQKARGEAAADPAPVPSLLHDWQRPDARNGQTNRR